MLPNHWATTSLILYFMVCNIIQQSSMMEEETAPIDLLAIDGREDTNMYNIEVETVDVDDGYFHMSRTSAVEDDKHTTTNLSYFDQQQLRFRNVDQELSAIRDAIREEMETSKSQAESETKRALGFQRLLQLAQEREKEMEVQMGLVQEELEVSKSQVLEIQQKCTSQEAHISELTEGLTLSKVSESQIKEDLLAKESQLEELKLKLQEEESAKVLIQDELKSQKAQLTLIQEQLAKATNEKEALDAVVVDLKTELAQTKDHSSDLEAKLQLSTKNLKAEVEETKLQAKELEKQSELLELKVKETESELEQISAKMSELNSTLASLEEEKKQLNQHVQDSTDKVIQLESELTQSSARNTELELKLKKYTDHDNTRPNSDQRAGELELLETKKYKIQELQEQMSKLEKKCKDTEEVHSRKVSEQESEIKVLRSKLAATKKEIQSTEQLVEYFRSKISSWWKRTTS